MAAKSTFSRQQRQEERLAWLFVLPVVLGIGIFQIYPTAFSLYASMTQWNLLTPPRWIGLYNYVDLFTTGRFFFQTMQDTGVYTLGVVVPAMIIALFFAILLNSDIRGKYLYRAIYFVPVIAPAVAVALLWNWLYEPNFGIINSALRVIGIQGPAWLGSTKWAMRAVIIEAIWAGLGFNIVIYLSGLQNISREYYEAASIDGAGFFHQFFYITLPLLSPVTFFILVTGMIGTFQDFTVPYIMTGGGPAGATQLVVMYLYGLAFRLQNMGTASAVAYLVFLVIVVLTALNFLLARRWVFYEEAV
ncbi:MAG: sugar ABC transporter permease [Caldilineaceae bacterium]|nr:sugar ABC transporter permease [Caldilineaceae bacterium]